MKVAIIRTGVVGKAMQTLFPEAVTYDEPLGLGSRNEVNPCDVAFVCVPTPGRARMYLGTSIVKEVVQWLDAKLIVLRSTVNPGTTDTLRKRYQKRLSVNRSTWAKPRRIPSLMSNTDPSSFLAAPQRILVR